LTEGELVGTCVLMLNAGHEATVNSTLIGWWTLFRHPDQLRRLRDDRSLLPAAIEELLSFDTPLQLFEGWVLEPFELHGQAIPKGAELGLIFGSANRDPEVFDRPDELDLGREPNPHLTFGAGIHFCLGAPLGRLELQTSFATLLDRFPRLEPVEETDVEARLHHPWTGGPLRQPVGSAPTAVGTQACWPRTEEGDDEHDQHDEVDGPQRSQPG
jgi:cytochrome P450